MFRWRRSASTDDKCEQAEAEAERQYLASICRELGVDRARQTLKFRDAAASTVYVTKLRLRIDDETVEVQAEAEGRRPSLDAAADQVRQLRAQRSTQR